MSAADRLDQIEARANAATDGPWVYGGKNRIETPLIDVDEADWGSEGLSGYAIHAQQDTGAWRYADAEFMAAARADVPALVAALRAVLDLHKPTDTTDASGIRSHSGCTACDWDVAGIEYPCPTVHAITEALG